MDPVTWRTSVITKHLTQHHPSLCISPQLEPSTCLSYTPPEISENISFDTTELRKLLDGHNLYERDWLFGIMRQSNLFCPKNYNGRVFVSPDYNTTMEQQREMTMRRIEYLTSKGVFNGWLTGKGVDNDLRKFGLNEVIGMYDHSLAVKLGVHFFLWGGAIQFFGTKRHHDKWLKDTENYLVKGCFAMSELGHGSNVRGIETVTTYDSNTGEFVINTPCESAQKYWIGGAANHATHTIVFSQLNINGSNQGVHAFIAQIRDEDGSICPNVRVADCGHKIGLNGVDNGRIWFDNVRIPRENLLNAVADVLPDGQYLSAIKDPDQRFAAFMAPLTSGRVTIAVSAIYSSKISLAIAIRYGLTRRAFSLSPNEPEVLLLDYPSHQRRLLPLLAKTCAMSFAANYLKGIYVKRTPEANKTIHVVSSAFKATFTWHNMKTLQECREACGGQGLKTENRVGHLKSEHDVQSTFEGDNNVLMQQVSKALIAEYIAAQRRKKPFKELGLEHMNEPSPVVPPQLTSTILRSNQFQTAIFCLRERDLLIRFAAEVSQHQARGESKEYAFILSYQLAEDLARAFTERAILQTFIETELTLSDAPLKKLKAQGGYNKFRKQSFSSKEEAPKSSLGKRKEREDGESDDDDSISVLTPTNTDCSLTDTIAMDCEMVGVSSQGNKSALARVTLVNAWGNIVYDEFVRPMERVVDFRTTISGIQPRDMRKAKDFGDVQTKVAELVKGRILVGHALHNDFKALLLSHPRNHIRDTSEYQPFLKEGRRRALKSLALEFLNAKIQDGEHCPVDDARAAMLLYQKHKKAWERSLKVHLKFKNKHKNRKPKRKNTEG